MELEIVSSPFPMINSEDSQDDGHFKKGLNFGKFHLHFPRLYPGFLGIILIPNVDFGTRIQNEGKTEIPVLIQRTTSELRLNLPMQSSCFKSPFLFFSSFFHILHHF